jgi:lysophospholipase-3
MGSIMTLHFLQSKSEAWKAQYIKSFVSLAGVWGGTVRALKVYLSGKI